MKYSFEQAFPEAAFDSEESEPDYGEKTVYDQIIRQIARDSRRIKQEYEEQTGKKWDLEHELNLADVIQAGNNAKEELIRASPQERDRLSQLVDAGLQARRDLVTANLPFAVNRARASVGGAAKPSNKPMYGMPGYYHRGSDYVGYVKKAGSYHELDLLSFPTASLEDRIQVACKAMWIASGKYRRMTAEELEKRGRGPAKFITYSAFPIQTALKNESLSEENGWYVKPGDYNNTENIHFVSHNQMKMGRLGVDLSSVTDVAAEESSAYDNPTELDLADLTEDTYIGPHREFELSQLQELIVGSLSELTEREREAMVMYLSALSGEPKKRSEIAQEMGISINRVGQLLTHSLDKLRHPVGPHSITLKRYLEIHDNPSKLPTTLEPLVNGTRHIKKPKHQTSGIV